MYPPDDNARNSNKRTCKRMIRYATFEKSFSAASMPFDDISLLALKKTFNLFELVEIFITKTM